MSNPQPLYLGIDPGASGGIAVVTPAYFQDHGTTTSRAWPMPRDEEQMWKLVQGIRELGKIKAVALEQVGGYVQGSGGNIGSAMFTFGRNYEMPLMAVVAAGVPLASITKVHPHTWQRSYPRMPKREPGEQPGAWKRRLKKHLKERAQKLFPGLKVTLATADALLIALWGASPVQPTKDRGGL